MSGENIWASSTAKTLILVILKSGEFYTTNFDVNNHYEPSILRIEKFSPDKIWCAVLYDADQQGYPYVKRFAFEPSTKPQSFMGENKDSRFVLLTDEAYQGCKSRSAGTTVSATHRKLMRKVSSA